MSAKQTANPFADDIVYQPRRLDRVVEALNARPLAELIGEFETLAAGEPPRLGRRLDHALFVTSSEPGYGKSHLIGRLFRNLSRRANLVYVSPFQAADTAWKSLLLRAVQELEFPERLDVEFCGPNEPSQLESFAHGVLGHLAAEAVETGAIVVKKKGGFTQWVLKNPVTKVRGRKQVLDFMERNLQRFALGLFNKTPNLNASPLTWLKILFRSAYLLEELDLRQACLDWLKGGAVDADEAEAIGIRPADRPAAEMSAAESDGLCKGRIVDLCRLASFYRPFVFCFDQTENYCKDPDLAKSLGLIVETLCREAPNQMTVVTANLTPWSKSIKPHWEEAHQQRLGPPIELEGINRIQGAELIRARIDGWADAPEPRVRVLDDAWLSKVFGESGEMGIRHFLKHCGERWLDRWVDKSKTLPAKETLEDLYTRNIEEIKTRPRRLVYDQDALYWLVHEAALGLPGVKVKKAVSPHKYFVLLWERTNGFIRFGLEDGSDFQRWSAIAREAVNLHTTRTKDVSVVFRTPDLAPIPKTTWKKTKALVEEAQKICLHVIDLTGEEMVRIYAAHDLYLDAAGGNVPYEPARVLEFVREQLIEVWRRIESGPQAAPTGQKKTAPGPERSGGPAGEPPAELIRQVREIVADQKFMSFSDLIKRLSGAWPEDMIHQARACVPEIKVKVSPRMTVLLWQSGG